MSASSWRPAARDAPQKASVGFSALYTQRAGHVRFANVITHSPPMHTIPAKPHGWRRAAVAIEGHCNVRPMRCAFGWSSPLRKRVDGGDQGGRLDALDWTFDHSVDRIPSPCRLIRVPNPHSGQSHASVHTHRLRTSSSATGRRAYVCVCVDLVGLVC